MDIKLFDELTEGLDPGERSAVLDGLREGFRLGVVDLPPPRGWAPSFMTNESRARITAYFEAETAAGRMLGPFTTQPSGRFWGDAVTFPVSEVEKSDGKFRTIFNLSYDWENSANAGIPASAAYTTYPSFERVAAEMTSMGLDEVYFCMYDIENAFRNLLIHPDDWIYQVVAWQRTQGGPREWYIDMALPFGIRVGPRIFNSFGDCLEYIMQQQCLSDEDRAVIGKMLRYLDDFLVMGVGKAETEKLLTNLLEMMKALRIPVKASKTVHATDAIMFIGFWWQPHQDLVTLSKARWEKLEREMNRINDALDSWTVTVDDIRSLSGVLCWAAKVIPYGMIYIRELYSVVSDLGLSSCSKAQGRATFFTDEKLIERIRLDLGWWLDLCRDYRTTTGAVFGRQISLVGLAVSTVEDPTLDIFSDMSGDGLGGYWRGTTLWCHSTIPTYVTLDRLRRHEKDYISSGHGEAAGILMCLLTFLPIWAARYPRRRPGTPVLVHSDSDVAVSVWNSQKGRSRIRPYLRAIERLCAFYNIELQLRFVPGVENVIADTISRLQDGSRMNATLREVFPEGDPHPQVPISHSRLFL